MDIERARQLIRLERPNRRRLIRESNTALALYSGGMEELSGLISLWSAQEDPANYQERLQITTDNYNNLLRQIINKYLEAITRAGVITRECKDVKINEYLHGAYPGFFWKEAAPYLFLLPEFWVQGAYPLSDGDYETEQQQLDMQGNPYLVVHYPQFIRNFEYNRDGTIAWVTIERPSFLVTRGATLPVMNVDFYDSSDYVTFEQRNATAGKPDAAISDKKFKQISDPTSHGFAGVPFRRFAFAENNALVGEPRIGDSRTADVIRGCKGYIHWLSMLVEAAHIHLRLQLVGPKKSIDEIKKEGMGNSTMIAEDGGLPVNSHPLRYLEKPSTEFDLLDKILYERKVNEIYDQARLRDTSVKKVAESGISKLLDMVPDLGVNKENRDYLLQCDTAIINLMANPDGGNKVEVTVSYPDSFDIKSINEKLKETEDMYASIVDGGLPRSMTADTMISKDLYSQRLPTINEASEKIIDGELKKSADAKLAAIDAQKNLNPTPIPFVHEPAQGVGGEGL